MQGLITKTKYWYYTGTFRLCLRNPYRNQNTYKNAGIRLYVPLYEHTGILVYIYLLVIFSVILFDYNFHDIFNYISTNQT